MEDGMTQIAATLLSYGIAVLLALLAATALWRPLNIILSELCGTEDRSRFWTIWTTVMVVIAPVLLVSGATVTTDPALLVRNAIFYALVGIVIAMMGMGYAIWARMPRDAR
jgi:hypothetical protein